MPHILSPSLRLAVQAYLPEDHRQLVEWTKNGRIRNYANIPQFDMYGSEDELMCVADFFRRFPGSHHFFGGELTQPFDVPYAEYWSLDDKPYMYKQHLLVRIYAFFFHVTNLDKCILAFYLRTKEQKLNGICEMVEYEEGDLVKFMKNMEGQLAKYNKGERPIKLVKKNLEGVMEKFKEFLPENKTDKEYLSVRKVVEDLNKTSPIERHATAYEDWINKTRTIVQCLGKLDEKHPKWFQPKPRQLPAIGFPATVRCFLEDGKQIVVLIREFMREVMRAGLDESLIPADFYNVVDMSIVPLRDVCNLVDGVTYVHHRSEKRKHRAVYIPSIEGDYFISTTDAILEALHEVIAVKKLFQNASKHEAGTISSIIEKDCYHATKTLENFSFINVELATSLKNKILQSIEESLPNVFSAEKLNIRRVGPNGFTVDDLKNELTRLNLIAAFPCILDYAQRVYDRVVKEKRKDVLDTRDMHDAIECCQRIGVLVKSEKLVQFFHDRNACSRLWIACPHCENDAEPMKLTFAAKKPNTFRMEMPRTLKRYGEPSESSFLSAFLAYLPQEHHHLLKWADGKLDAYETDINFKLYGCKSQLMACVKTFLQFPGSHNVLGCSLTETISTSCVRLQSLNRELYIYKPSTFILLLEQVYKFEKSPEVCATLSYYLRAKEHMLKGMCDMIPYHSEAYEAFRRDLQERYSNEEKVIKLKKKTLEGVMEMFKEILPENKFDKDYEAIRKLLTDHSQNKAVKRNWEFYEDWINKTALIIEEIESFIVEHPKWFKPKSLWPKSWFNGEKAIVRILVEDEKGFVLGKELLTEMNRAGLDTSLFAAEVSEMRDLGAFDWEDIRRRLGPMNNEIEFIVTHIKRTRHHAVYIPTIDGHFFIPSADAILNLLHLIITVRKSFQDASKTEVQTICGYITALLIPERLNNARFIYLEQFSEMKKALYHHLEQDVPEVVARKKVDIREVSRAGFTQKDLEIELKRLRLDKPFPNILQLAKGVYQRINEAKTLCQLQTRDMYDAVECCPRMSIFTACPMLLKFLHDQDACERLWISCPNCVNGSGRIKIVPSKSA